MRRRRVLQAITAFPAFRAPAQYLSPGQAAEETPKLRETAPDGVAQPKTRFLRPDQLAAFRNLAEILVPKGPDRPSAVEAGAVEFLDFLLSQSSPERQALFKNGLDVLNNQSQKRFGKPFAQLTSAEAKPLLEPLTRPWTYHPPQDPQERFLREAKEDLLLATANSKPFADAMSKRSRAAAGLGAYWLPFD
ncbi:MAG: gluconate 2-dehydrogenase subunit 3 family protein [Bryobacteraceae bacterium]|nr:gluconate 2-dehydrogenase subunit 3 family protein [Bryobacteraceae bacterium]MDW8377970.1 gluconate 2-dehydrogenase subunit 3 family protein [Bryobacterales bacterium]